MIKFWQNEKNLLTLLKVRESVDFSALAFVDILGDIYGSIKYLQLISWKSTNDINPFFENGQKDKR